LYSIYILPSQIIIIIIIIILIVIIGTFTERHICLRKATGALEVLA